MKDILKFIFTITSLLCLTIPVSAVGNPLMDNEWREVQNYPDFGVLTFKAKVGVLQGSYKSVGEKQNRVYGFKAGDVVLKLEQKNSLEFNGEVLLRSPLKYCNQNCDNWVPISMLLDKNSGKLIGKWPQSKLNKNTGKREFVRWQSYVLLQH